MSNNRKLAPELLDIKKLKSKILISYIFSNNEYLEIFRNVYHQGKERLSCIIDEAKKETDRWKRILDLFNSRFEVPFKIEVVNQDDVILKDKAPSLIFHYEDKEDGVDKIKGKDELMNALCTGERRALYLLNAIFDIEARKDESYQTLLVIDDIADSFDYKNKYAIIQYLKDIRENGKFSLIILTHNFDFCRTIRSRLSIDRKNCFEGIRTENCITISQAEYLNNPFKHWKDLLNIQINLIASIPMVRELIDYTKDCDNEDYNTLTSILHYKEDSKTITLKELIGIFKRTVNKDISYSNPETDIVFNLILEQANECLNDTDETKLENKFVLSMAIRLVAERYMIRKINDLVIVKNIKKDQTSKLFHIYKKKFPGDSEAIKLLEKVILMTPEIIHLNAFMNEPIVDISIIHLQKLYSDISNLC